MSKKRTEFPIEIKQGSLTVKVYKVRNKCYRVRTKAAARAKANRQDQGGEGTEGANGDSAKGPVELKERFSYMVSYFADGRRFQKMFADLEEAKAEAKSKATALSKGDLDVLHLSSADCRAYTHSLHVLEPTGMALEVAIKEYVAAWELLGGKALVVEAAREFARRKLHDLPRMMVPEAVKQMLEIRAKDGTSKAYMKVLRVYLNQFGEAFQTPLGSVTPGEIADHLRSMDVSGRSRNNARATIGAFFKFCKERGWLAKDHDGIELVPKFKENGGDIEVFTPWEMTQFLNYARPELVPFLAIGAFAGLRSAEIERLDWSEVHLEERFIEVKAIKAKTASRRLVPILENLAKWLAPYAQETGRVVPFDNMSKQLGWLAEDARTAVKEAEAMAESKSPKGDSAAGKAKKLTWKKNALRHSFISYRVADIQNVAQVALEAGNSPQIIFKNYRELVRPKAAKEWFGIVPKAA